jgi:hypothetical protein
LSAEAARASGAEPIDRLAVVNHFFRQEFEGDGPSEPIVLGPVDHSHAAGAELADDAVMGNGSTDHA